MSVAAGTQQKAPRELQLAGAVIPAPGQEMKMDTSVAHPPWCDPRCCTSDDTGIEAIVDHRSTPFRLEQAAGLAEVYVARTCTTWSETQGPRRVVLTVPETTDINELRGFNAWLRGCLDQIEEMTTSLPHASVCPNWCTADVDGDERVRADHAWRYHGWHGTGYMRTHWGPIGKTYRTQGEMTDAATGRSRWGRVVAGRRIARTAVLA
jgi:hypothetical protein